MEPLGLVQGKGSHPACLLSPCSLLGTKTPTAFLGKYLHNFNLTDS